MAKANLCHHSQMSLQALATAKVAIVARAFLNPPLPAKPITIPIVPTTLEEYLENYRLQASPQRNVRYHNDNHLGPGQGPKSTFLSTKLPRYFESQVRALQFNVSWRPATLHCIFNLSLTGQRFSHHNQIILQFCFWYCYWYAMLLQWTCKESWTNSSTPKTAETRTGSVSEDWRGKYYISSSGWTCPKRTEEGVWSAFADTNYNNINAPRLTILPAKRSARLIWQSVPLSSPHSRRGGGLENWLL